MYKFSNVSYILGNSSDMIFNIFSIISVVYVSFFSYIGFTLFGKV